MDKNTHHSRLLALDGLRGFAILLVFLNHIPTTYVQLVLPLPIFGWILSNGVTGVTFLFILSGFLMATLYPNPTSGFAFLQKRYTRIFPLFLTMSLVMVVTRQFHASVFWQPIAVLVIAALVTHTLWVYGIKRFPFIFSKSLFFGFLLLQAIVGLTYVLVVARQPINTFAHLPTVIHEGFIYLVNATLTLPLGDYIPMLDGVYWTLVAEVLFYCLYPFLVVPLVDFLRPKNLAVKLAFLGSLFFLFGGIHMLSYKIFVLSLVQPALFFYFATGISLAYVYKNRQEVLISLSNRFSQLPQKYSFRLFIFGEIAQILLYFSPLLLFFLACMTIHDLSFLGPQISPWVRMIFAIPFTLLVGLMLIQGNILNKLFSTKFIVFVGVVSYSIYLSHSLLIGIAKSIYLPTNLVANIVYIIVVFLITCGIAYFLFTLLEKPYFTSKQSVLSSTKKNLTVIASEAKQSLKQIQPSTRVCLILFSISLLYLLAVFTAYQSKDRYNFFSTVAHLPVSDFLNPQIAGSTTPFVIKGNTQIVITFKATDNNLGLLALQLNHKPNPRLTAPQALQFTLKEKGSNTVLEMANYSLDQFDKNEEFPFGFPEIVNSQGKTYLAEFFLTNPDSKDFITVNPLSAQEVYQLGKAEFLKHPGQLVNFVGNKLQAIFSSQEALLVLLFLLPFLCLSIFLSLY